MPKEALGGEVYLALEVRDGFVLEAYEAMPTGSEPPRVSVIVPGMPSQPLLTALKSLLADKSLPDDKVRALQQMGDILATWLFTTQTDSAAVPSRPAARRSLNPVGVYLQKRALHLQQPQRLRVWLSVAKGPLEWVPFESLEHNRFIPVKIVRGIREPLLSSCTVTRAPASLAVADKLRVVLVSANPDAIRTTTGYPHLQNLETHCEVFESALAPLKHARECFFRVLHNPTPEHVQAMLRRYNPHVLVFAGHGYGWRGTGRGGLICVRDGVPVEWPFTELTRTLQEIHEPALRLGVFIACQSFVAAPGLLAAGVPAVVAMQPLGRTNFPEAGVSVFAEPFFRTLAHYGPLSAAHAHGCQALEHHSAPGVSLMPTLWLATPQDRLFDDDPDNRRRARYLDALLGKPDVALCALPGADASVPLAEVYVEQPLVTQYDDGPPTEVNLWDIIRKHHRVLVEAPVWAGKSALCQWLTQQCVQATGWIPIVCHFWDLAHSAKSVQQYLAENYIAWLGLEEPHLAMGQWLYDQWQAGQALLIVDGVDEEGVTARRAQTLAALMVSGDATPVRVVLTSRPGGDNEIAGVQTCGLPVLTPPQMAQLVQHCGMAFGTPGQATPFIEAMDQVAPAHVRHLTTRAGSVIRMFAAYVYEDRALTATDTLLGHVAAGRFGITGRVEPPLDPDESTDKRQVAEAIGFHLLVCQHGQPQTREAMLALVQQALVAAELDDVYTAAEDCVTLLEDLCRNSGFLTCTTHGAYAWESPSWLQFFAAYFIKRKLREGHADFARWVAATSAARARRVGLCCPLCAEPLPLCPHALRRAE